MHNIYFRILALCVYLTCFVLTAFSQGENYSVRKTSSTQYNSGSNVITPEEKARLQQQFNGENFHISDEGLVVYTPEPVNQNPQSASYTDYNKKEQQSTPQPSKSYSDVNTGFVKKEKTPVNFVSGTGTPEQPQITREYEYVSESVPVKRVTPGSEPAKNTTPTPAPVVEKKKTVKETIKKQEEKKQVETNTASKSRASNSSFGKKEPLKYSSLEEAYLATVAKIDQIKKDSSGDLTNRVKGGRSSSANIQDFDRYDFRNDYEEVDLSKFGTEPSYFINGVQVEKKEFFKLKDKDILSRIVRTKDTVTGNPNGEIWVETRDN